MGVRRQHIKQDWNERLNELNRKNNQKNDLKE